MIGGWFAYDGTAGLTPVGEVRYTRLPDGGRLEASYDSGLLRLATGHWLVEVFFRGEVLTDLGEEAESIITESVSLEVVNDWPVINLTSPFVWGVESPVRPTVGFERFLITIGCDSSAVACTDNEVAQVLALADGVPGSPDLSDAQRDVATIETNAPRSTFDPHYFDPGPLAERNSADLIWTGEELIVWGGKTVRDGPPTLIDGAAFDPEVDEWRMLAPIPLEGPSPSRAVWGDGEMIVISTDGVFGYNSSDDVWRFIAEGLTPSEWPGRVVYIDGRVLTWTEDDSVAEVTIDTGQIRVLDAPTSDGDSGVSHFDGVLRAFNGRMVGVTNSGSFCDGKRFHRLAKDTWVPLPEESLATSEYADCSTANQSAFVSNDLFIWDSWDHPTKAYSFFRNEWRTLDPIPLGGAEGAAGPVVMGQHHFLVPRWGEGAIFDATTDSWILVQLPGQGMEREIIWTGSEFLAWGIWGTFDAWRWTPEVGLIGGDDAR